MNESITLKVAQAILFTIPWTTPIFLMYTSPATFRELFTTVAIVWAVVSPLILLGTSIVSYRCGTIKSSLTKQPKR